MRQYEPLSMIYGLAGIFLETRRPVLPRNCFELTVSQRLI